MLETGSDRVEQIMGSRTPLATATIAYAETYAALTRRHRDGSLPAADDRLLQAARGEGLAILNVETR